MFNAGYIITLESLIQQGNPAEGALELMEALERECMPYIIVTEQSGRYRDQIYSYLKERDFKYLHLSNIYTSTMAAVDYFARKYPEKRKAAYIGGQGMQKTLSKGGYTFTGDNPDFLFAGMNKSCTYEDYSKALQIMMNGAELISVDNRKIQMIEGMPYIGNASIVQMLSYASNKKYISFGRGSLNYLAMSARYLNHKPGNIIFVSNDFRQDIIPALKYGMNTAYITEGRAITNIGINEEFHPDYIIETLSGLAK